MKHYCVNTWKTCWIKPSAGSNGCNTVKWLTFSMSFIFPFFPECFHTRINNTGKTQYMSGLNRHKEIFVLSH